MSLQSDYRRPALQPLSVRTRDMTAAWRHVDWVIVAVVSALTLIGFALVHSASRQFETGSMLPRQLVFALMSVGVMAAVAAIDYRRIIAKAQWVYLGLLFLLVVVLVCASAGDVHDGRPAHHLDRT